MHQVHSVHSPILWGWGLLCHTPWGSEWINPQEKNSLNLLLVTWHGTPIRSNTVGGQSSLISMQFDTVWTFALITYTWSLDEYLNALICRRCHSLFSSRGLLCWCQRPLRKHVTEQRTEQSRCTAPGSLGGSNQSAKSLLTSLMATCSNRSPWRQYEEVLCSKKVRALREQDLKAFEKTNISVAGFGSAAGKLVLVMQDLCKDCESLMFFYMLSCLRAMPQCPECKCRESPALDK